MKKALMVLLMVVGLVSVSQAAEAKAVKTVKLAFRDYGLYDQDVRPITFGICTWTDSETSCDIAGYLDVTVISLLNDKLRFGAGVLARAGDFNAVDFKMETSVTTRLFDWLEVGAYYCPFWGLANEKFNDDPAYGLMVGYAIKL
jgi:hypothetical protein